MQTNNSALVLLRGGGDLATGVALRLHRAGIKVIISELEQPLAVRRAVSFAEAVYEGRHTVEGVTARLVKPDQILTTLEANEIPVLIDPNADILTFDLRPSTFIVMIDGRLTKQPPAPLPAPIPLHIGLGPGFHAGVNCQAVVETRRGHTLGRVYWNGTTQADSGQPEGDPRRVLRAPSDGVLTAKAKIGEHLKEGLVIAVVDPNVILSEAKNLPPHTRDSSLTAQSDMEIISPFKGVLRGLIRDGIHVTEGLKIGDIDPRDDASACFLVSDKALAIGGAVLEAILTRGEIREQLWK
ncbi:MAG TPA: hypothetical protein VF918_04545 [Anaerolineales bacterium]